MKLTLISAYYPDGRYTGCEQVSTKDQVEAITQFRRYNPEFIDCIVVARTIDSNDTRYQELVHTILYK